VCALKQYTSFEELETLCEAMIKDFFRSRHYTNVLCVDIESFVQEYLGMSVLYESIAEEDAGRIGFLSDGHRPLWIRRQDISIQQVFPARTVVIEKYLQNPRESARKRFTIAHEGAHDVLEKHVPLQGCPTAAFHSEFDMDMPYSGDMLREMMSVNECLANRAAACLLMPRFLMDRVLKRFNHSDRIVVYESEGGTVLSQDQKLLIQKMADAMGVSYTAFYLRLKELCLLEYRPVEAYLYNELCYGGNAGGGDH